MFLFCFSNENLNKCFSSALSVNILSESFFYCSQKSTWTLNDYQPLEKPLKIHHIGCIASIKQLFSGPDKYSQLNLGLDFDWTNLMKKHFHLL